MSRANAIKYVKKYHTKEEINLIGMESLIQLNIEWIL